MMPSNEFIGQNKEDLDTPVLLVDLDKFEANINHLAEFCRTQQTAWRPHSKAHKCPQIAELEIQAGALGITCAKLSEAEVMAEHGVNNILIANQIVTPNKMRRLAALQNQARVITTLDNTALVGPLGAAATSCSTVIPVLIDVDIGMNRTGIGPGLPVLELARQICSNPGLEFAGLMGYEGHVLDIQPPAEKIRVCHQALEQLIQSRDLLQKNGIPVEIISAGGTGCYQITAAYPGITEIQAGGGIFMDNMYRSSCNVDDLDFALTVLATVTSRHPGHAVTDAGFKTMSSHEPPTPIGRDDLELRYLSAEHGVFDIKPGFTGPEIGDQIEFVVGYSDSTNFLHDRFVGVRQGTVEKVWDLLGRGKLT